jgi:hypothetical protein
MAKPTIGTKNPFSLLSLFLSFFRIYYDLNGNKLRRFLKMQKGKNLGFRMWQWQILAYADLGVV